MNVDDFLKKALESFDSLDLDNEYVRRTAVKPLYDFYQVILLEVGVWVGLNRSTLSNTFVKTRWDYVKPHLSMVTDDSDKWDQTINTLNNLRRRSEHQDYEIPKKNVLEELRKKAPEFHKWMISARDEYFKQEFSVLQQFRLNSRIYIQQVESALNDYGDDIPYSVKQDLISEAEFQYRDIKPLSDTLVSRLAEIRIQSDITGKDIDTLVRLVREIERLRGRETVYVNFGTCPKCGGEIVETERTLWTGPYDDPEPAAVVYRIGCKNCNYEIHSDKMDV